MISLSLNVWKMQTKIYYFTDLSTKILKQEIANNLEAAYTRMYLRIYTKTDRASKITV